MDDPMEDKVKRDLKRDEREMQHFNAEQRREENKLNLSPHLLGTPDGLHMVNAEHHRRLKEATHHELGI